MVADGWTDGRTNERSNQPTNEYPNDGSLVPSLEDPLSSSFIHQVKKSEVTKSPLSSVAVCLY